MARKLSEKRKKFVDAYLGKAAGNATKAAKIAGYKNPTMQGSRLLTFDDVSQEISRRQKIREKRTDFTVERRMEILADIAEGRMGEVKKTKEGIHITVQKVRDTVKAIDVANKMEGIYVTKHEVTMQNDLTPEETREKVIEMVRRWGYKVTKK